MMGAIESVATPIFQSVEDALFVSFLLGALPVAGRGSSPAYPHTGTESPEFRQFSGLLGLLFMAFAHGIDA